MLRRFGTALLFVSIFASQIQAAACGDVNELPPESLVNFLRMSAHTADPQCVGEAVIRLGELRPKDRASIDVLISLLDFRRPATEMERMHISTMRDWFPAVSALVATGTRAVEPLIASLQGGELTETARQNAIRATLYIYSGDPPRAVSMLGKAAQKAPTQLAAVALESSARDAAKLCSKSWKSRCEAASK